MWIEKLSGTFIESLPSGIIVDLNGVGYGVEMPLSAICELPPTGNAVELWIHTYVKDDALRLFGFLSARDRSAFEILISVNGVGPKVALAILSTLSVPVVRQAVLKGKTSIFENVPGIGKRLAEKILVELKAKLPKLQNAVSLGLPEQEVQLDMDEIEDQLIDEDSDELVFDDIRSALVNLGFTDKVVLPIIEKLKENNSDREFNALLKEALLLLRGGVTKRGGKPKSKNLPEKDLVQGELF